MAVVDKAEIHTALPAIRDRQTAEAWVSRYLSRAFALDFTAMLVAALVAFVVRFPGVPEGRTEPYIWFAIALPMLSVGTLSLVRAYEPRFIGVGSEEFRRVLHGVFLLGATIAIVAYATKTDVARGYVFIAMPLAAILNVGARYWLRKSLHRRRWAGKDMRRVVALGHRAAVADLIRLLRQQRYHGMDIVAVCLPPGLVGGDQASMGDAVTEVEGVPVLGDFGQAAQVVERIRADSVAVLACPELDGTALRRLAWRIERDDVELVVAPALMDVAGPRISIRPVSGLPLLHVEHPELSGGRQLVKALFDRAVALTGLVVLAPLLLGIALAIRLTSPGPALFRQIRVGKNGKEFVVLKFRTMVVDAEARKPDLLELNEHDGLLFKIKRDPRVTGIGRWLRRYSVDELPQLINVLRGDMSLVGPRPPLREEVDRYGADVHRRLVVKPGLTGLWQVSGRSDLSWEESVRLDLRYVENWSLMMDLQIIWKTWYAVMRGSGAY